MTRKKFNKSKGKIWNLVTSKQNRLSLTKDFKTKFWNTRISRICFRYSANNCTSACSEPSSIAYLKMLGLGLHFVQLLLHEIFNSQDQCRISIPNALYVFWIRNYQDLVFEYVAVVESNFDCTIIFSEPAVTDLCWLLDLSIRIWATYSWALFLNKAGPEKGQAGVEHHHGKVVHLRYFDVS